MGGLLALAAGRRGGLSGRAALADAAAAVGAVEAISAAATKRNASCSENVLLLCVTWAMICCAVRSGAAGDSTGCGERRLVIAAVALFAGGCGCSGT